MNVLFLSLSRIGDLHEKSVYTDLLREFVDKGHNVYIVTPVERKYKQSTSVITQKQTKILKVKTLNIQKTNIIEKGIGTILIEYNYLNAVKKYFGDVSFDLILYGTPPITLVKTIKYAKKRWNSKTYLLLKDIFPQNAVDIGMMSRTGIKGILYKYFRAKEKRLYEVSDYIGCMSQANVDYVIGHNPSVHAEKVEICPNCIENTEIQADFEERSALRSKFGLPQDKKIIVYGGNLGKPQDIPHLLKCIQGEADNSGIHFLVVGDGTDYNLIETYVRESKPTHLTLLQRLPADEYDKLIAACDVGMIFLDYRFTIPNFPSRLLSYMQVGLPVLACTDPNTDIGKVITDGGFGVWCPSNSIEEFHKSIDAVLKLDSSAGMNGKQYLKEHYSVSRGYSIIMNSVMTK